MVAKTFVINLDRDVEKWKQLQQSVSWPVERFSAIDGALVKDRPFHLNAFMVGCLMSHRALWKRVARETEPCLILEDDCVFPAGFVQEMQRVMGTIPKDYDLAVLGYSGSDVDGDVLLSAGCYPVMRRRTLMQVNDDWWVPGIWIGCHCYMLTPAGAKKLCLNTDMYHADAVLNRDSSLVVYCPNSSLVSQSVRVGMFMYNQHVTYEWLLLEPVIALGPVTLRLGHIVAAYIALTGWLLLSKRQSLRTAGCAVAVVPLIHYFGTRSHVGAGLRRRAAETAPHCPRTERLHGLNDALSVSTVLIVSLVAHSQGRFHQVMRAYLGLLTTKMAVSSLFASPDPSQVCDRRSLQKKTLFEYCSDSAVSGHMIPSLILANLNPALGLPLAAAQASTILGSKARLPIELLCSVFLVQGWLACSGLQKM
eukprot:5265-Heterococcus_DN1.PRE.15